MLHFVEKEKAQEHLDKVARLLRSRFGTDSPFLFEQLEHASIQMPPALAERIRGACVILTAIASGERLNVRSDRFGRWFDELIETAVPARRVVRDHGRQLAGAFAHAILLTGLTGLIVAGGWQGSLFGPLLLLVWCGYAYIVTTRSLLPFIRARSFPIGGVMRTRANWFWRIVGTLLILAGAVLLGATFGIGGVIFAAVLGLALILRVKLKRGAPAVPPEVNPASGFLMQGDLLDVRGNPYGTRRDD
jgi:hypothetical protein